MKKLIIIFLLVCIDIILGIYLKNISLDKKVYLFNGDDNKYLIQLNEIELNSIDEFEFDNFFKVIGFNNEYVYRFDSEYIYVTLDGIKEYKFKYNLIEPKIIEKIIYKEIEKPVIEESVEASKYFYVDSNVFVFDKDTDLDIIRSSLISNLHTTYQTNIDYSRLNVSHVGRYSVFYITNDEKIEIFVEIR